MFSEGLFFVKYNECEYIKFDVKENKANYGIMPHNNADTPICLNKEFGTIEFVYSNGSVAAYGPDDKLIRVFTGAPSCKTRKSKKNKDCRPIRATPLKEKDENPKPNEINEPLAEQESDFTTYHLPYWVIILILCFIIVIILALNCTRSKKHCRQCRPDTVEDGGHEHNHISSFTSQLALTKNPKSGSKSSLFNRTLSVFSFGAPLPQCAAELSPFPF